MLWFFFGFGLFGNLYAQSKELKVLFLGNSYTYVNNLPKLLKDMAFSTGDTLFTDENTPGGYRLMGHASNATSIAKIKSAQWDYVVLQDQSQLPSFPEADVQVMVYPFARALDSMIQENYACSKTVFYMTWGRKNGDAQNCAFWPPVCTYQGMDSLLALRYRKMANDNKALLSPVGALWRYLRTNHPTIELYQSDESHPSLAGTYAAACSFYAVILRKDPTLITYDGGLPAAEALAIRAAAKWVVYQNLGDLNMGLFEPKAHFKHVISGLNSRLVQFENQSTNADSYMWHFGDGDTSTQVNP
ncbi:MAG: PKD domain-containing protein, partial [Bacteroidia bacterium]